MHTYYHLSYKATIHIAIRVIIALILREIHTLHGDSKLGYFWAIIRTAFGIAVFWAIRTVMHFHAPHGMTILTFLCMGFLIFNIFSQTLTTCMDAIKDNRNLLTYPQVFPLDVMIARTLVITCTQIVSMTVIMGMGLLAGFPVHVASVGLLLIALLSAMCFGFGCGIILSTLSWYIPALKKMIPMLVRVLFFASGVFFSVSAFSHQVGSWLLLNPVMQLIEMARTAMASGYVSPYYDIKYVLGVNLCVLTLGFLLERFIRRKLQA